MENDPDLKRLIDEPTAIRWIGPDAHIVAYPIKAHNGYNIVSTHISNTVGLTEDWTARASKEIMLKRFDGWNDKLMKASSQIVFSCCRSVPMKTWIADLTRAYSASASHPKASSSSGLSGFTSPSPAGSTTTSLSSATRHTPRSRTSRKVPPRPARTAQFSELCLPSARPSKRSPRRSRRTSGCARRVRTGLLRWPSRPVSRFSLT